MATEPDPIGADLRKKRARKRVPGGSVCVICGRDEVDATAPTHDEVFAQLNEERVNLRARRYLRDLRRDAVIEFR